MAYNTNNPVPSSSPFDLFDNSENFDEGMNSTADTFRGRRGQNLYTWSFFHRLTASALAQINVTIGEAQTAVNNAADAAIAEMEETAAALGDDLNNKHYLTYAEMVADPQTRDAVVAVVDADDDPDLNGWYSWGLSVGQWQRFVDQPVLESGLEKKVPAVEGISNKLVPLMFNDQGQVVLWLENGRIKAAGFEKSVLESTQKIVTAGAYSSSMMPLMLNDKKQVVAWLKGGVFDAAGLAKRIKDSIAVAANHKYSDSSTMWAYRARAASALTSGGIAKVVITGDSWTENTNEIPANLAASLYATFGQSGQGWVTVNTRYQLNGVQMIRTGFTLADMTPDCDALDGHAVSATGTAATLSLTGLKTESLRWYYKDGDGSFRYSVDGGAATVVSGGGTGTRKYIDITGLSDAVHAIAFDLVGNSGTVTFFGGMATRSASGIELSKAGNGGSTAVQWQSIAPYVQNYATEYKPDAVIVILGTNDLNQSITKASFKAGIQALVNAYKAGSPNCSIILVTPIRAQSTTDLGLIAKYAEATYEISQATANVEFINLNAFMPPRILSSTLGMWVDDLHLSVPGGKFVADLLMKYFFKNN